MPEPLKGESSIFYVPGTNVDWFVFSRLHSIELYCYFPVVNFLNL